MPICRQRVELLEQPILPVAEGTEPMLVELRLVVEAEHPLLFAVPTKLYRSIHPVLTFSCHNRGSRSPFPFGYDEWTGCSGYKRAFASALLVVVIIGHLEPMFTPGTGVGHHALEA